MKLKPRRAVSGKKEKESHSRPGLVHRVPGGLDSQISWHSTREGGEVVSLTNRPPLPPGTFLILIFTRGWVDPRAMVRSEGNMSLKNPVTPPGIDAGTFRLVAQCLNHYATPKVKESRNRPGVAQRVPGGLGSQISMTFGTWRWWGCQAQVPDAFTTRKCSWYSFSLGVKSTPGPWNCRKEYVTEKSSDTTGNRSRDRPTSSAAP